MALRLAGQRGFYSAGSKSGPLNSEMSDNDPSRIEKAKEELLTGHTDSSIPNAPGWNETLASESEAIIKADTLVKDGESISKLQKETIEHIQKKH
ncbi:hypothetical protein IWQ60_008250 [Tieghemiomyces parasiticus]|uniref:Uncharacterized protein n=1 Tax=Tieghemiomyces parasiticus TaxID=78921 RepID=A0A9W7ZZL4_9FUNG|nr:hypothetical protein IWQ60_008250 [Tieghemiomyces parasiticus]